MKIYVNICDAIKSAGIQTQTNNSATSQDVKLELTAKIYRENFEKFEFSRNGHLPISGTLSREKIFCQMFREDTK